MDIKERIKFYEENYGFLPLHINKGGKIYIGDKNNRYCRFCGRRKPEVKFRNIAHALPEFLGNKQLISLQECDECNSFFSNNIESHLDKFTRPFRTISLIKGKIKIPSYKTNDKKSRLDFIKNQGFVSSETIDQRISDIDFEKKQVTFTFTYEPYIPSAVYKSFVKMALSIIPEDELPPFKNTIKWILNSDHSKKLIRPQIVRALFIPGINPNKILTVFLLRRRQSIQKEELPYCIFVIGFGNFVYQLIVPSLHDFKNAKTVNFSFPAFPTAFELDGGVAGIKFRLLDLTEHEIVKNKKEKIIFNFDSVEKIEK
ncbi:MAG: HNH endonuclease [Candidatus Omnitrophica bacterium]|nr:HNH endonuclease [Candidatus Omnitrophota bacterium]